MDYQKIHDSLIERAKNRILSSEEIVEKHHIIPQSLGGSNKKNNIVILTAKEHYIIHLLLVKINPTNSKLAYAFWMMCNGQKKNRNYKVSSRMYSFAKQEVSKFLKQRTPPFLGKTHTQKAKNKISNSKKGKLPPVAGKKYSEESKQKQREARLGKKDSLETKLKKSKSMVGIKKSKEHSHKISLAQTGKNNNMHGVTGYNNPRSKNIIQYDLKMNYIREWPNARIASQELNLNYQSLNNCCLNKTKTSGGFIWKYKESLED